MSILKSLNLTSIFILVIYPVILVSLVILYGLSYQIHSSDLVLFALGYYGSNIAVGVGLHRLWSHGSYKTNKYIEFILVVFAAATLQGPVLSWASNHFKHHTYTDTERDPHTPLRFKNKIKGFLWSHIGWMLIADGSYQFVDRVTLVKLGRNKLLKWQMQYYWHISIIMNSLVPALIGYAIGGTLIAAYAGFLFIGLGRAIQQQMTFCVNSLCHFVGTKKYTKGTAGDIWWLAGFLLGENWHNFHHAFPTDYRNGPLWYQIDVHKWIIYIMHKMGLAWDLQITDATRMQVKITQKIAKMIDTQKTRLMKLQKSINNIATQCQLKLGELDDLSIAHDTKNNLQQSLDKIQVNIQLFNKQISNQIANAEYNDIDNIYARFTKQLANIEGAIQSIYRRIDMAQSI